MKFILVQLSLFLLLSINTSAQLSDLEGKVKVTGMDTVTNSSYKVVVDGDGMLEILADTIERHYVGELWGGGIVYYTYNNGENGLIVSPFDLSDTTGIEWQPDPFSGVLIGATSYGDGPGNTQMIVAELGVANYPAYMCDTLDVSGFTDWYLPAKSELLLLRNAFSVVEMGFENDGDPTTYSLIEQDFEFVNAYWSSTEASAFEAENVHFNSLDQGGGKSREYRVRAIRRF